MNYLELLEKVYTEGVKIKSRGEETKECMNLDLEIDSANLYSWPLARPLSKIMDYANKELAWYLSCDRGSEYIQDKAKLWEKIKNKDGSINSQYGYLVFEQKTAHPSLGDITMTGFEWAKYTLLKEIDTRRAIITFNNGGYNYESDDFLCTQHMAFFVRNGKLDCFIALRSSDLIYGQPYNQIFWSMVHQQLFLSLVHKYKDLKLGKIMVKIYSAHLYSKHYKLVSEMLSEKPERFFLRLVEILPIGNEIDFYLKNFGAFRVIEKVY